MMHNKFITRISLIGLIINIIVNMIYYRYFIIEEMIIRQVAESNIKVADIYTKNIWNQNRDAINKLHKFGYMKLLQDEDFIKFASLTINAFITLNTKISIYDLQGNKIITNSPLRIKNYEYKSKNYLLQKLFNQIDILFLKKITENEAFNKAFSGYTNHVLIPNVMIQIENSNQFECKSFIKSYIPIIDLDLYNYPVDGVIEIITDITSIWSDMLNLEKKVLITFLVILVILILIIMSTTNYAQRIIDHQLEINKNLEEAVIKVRNESSAHTKFFANVSHELRTPLNAIIGFSEIMISKKSYEDISYAKDINEAGKHLLSIINDILDLSKASANKLSILPIETNLNKLIFSTLRLVKPKAEESNIQLLEEFPKEQIILFIDPKRLKQVMLNLLSNAIKFTPKNGIIRIEVTKDEYKKIVLIKIKDNGIGIEEKNIPKILSTFGQIDNAETRKYDGTGLGLPLTRKLVELMSGNFFIQSKLGYGTTVTISLPYKKNLL